MGNAEYIEKYKNEDEIIRTYFQIRDRSGKLVNIDGIVNPIEIDNRQCASVVDDQGSKPHCAAYSICSLIEALNWKLTGRIVNLNADQVYAHAKLIDGDVSSEGTYLECAIKAAAKLGGFKNPDKIKIGFMYNDKSDKSIERFKYLIHKYDFVHCGFNIDTGWYACNEKDPFIKKTNIICGGHAVLCVGYDTDGAYIQNSWGTTWGSKGFAVLPWKYFKEELMYACFIQNEYDGLNEG